MKIRLQQADILARFMIKKKWGIKNPPPWLLAYEKGENYTLPSPPKKKLEPNELKVGHYYTVNEKGEVFEA